MRGLRLLVALLIWAAPVWAETGVWVQATGHAEIISGDRTGARQRALADAMLSAALAGGAEVRGHSALQNGVLTSDIALIRPTSRLLRHEILSEGPQGGLWQVQIRAEVAPLTDAQCSGQRILPVTVFAPQIEVSPQAPAWTVQLAHLAMTDLIAALDRHPKITLTHELDKAAPNGLPRIEEEFSYAALNRGTEPLAQGSYALTPRIEVRPAGTPPLGRRLDLSLTLHMDGIGIPGIRQTLSRSAPMPAKSGLAVLAGRSVPAAREGLTQGLTADVTATLNALTCEAPVARARLASGQLTVPLGRRNGLSRSSLAFLTDRSDSFAALEVVDLSDRSATLRPLDQSRSAGSFDGLELTFLETGL